MSFSSVDKDFFQSAGLNVQAIFAIADLPKCLLSSLEKSLPEVKQYKQLILLGHLGTELWKAMKPVIGKGEDPVDCYTIDKVNEFFKKKRITDFNVVYPSSIPINLQELGKIAGWHYPTPFKVGANKHWGSWFAYRAVVITNTEYATTEKMVSESPCETCQNKECISACPAKALDTSELVLESCVAYRRQRDSLCKNTCLSRVKCPVGNEYRYTEDQINYHYSVSMKTIEKLY